MSSSQPPASTNFAEGRAAPTDGSGALPSEASDGDGIDDDEGGRGGGGGGCYRYFGVRSHLHQLYDYSDDAVAAADAERGGRKKWAWWGRPDAGADAALLPWRRRQQQRRRRSCGALLWLAVTWLGAFSLFAGLALMLAGYAVPRQAPIVGYASLERLQQTAEATTATLTDAVSAMEAALTTASGVGVAGDEAGAAAASGDLLLVDRSALDLNAALDACKVAGLVTLCSGGVILALALAGPLAAASVRSPLPCAAACRRPSPSRRSAAESSAGPVAAAVRYDQRRCPCDDGSSDDSAGGTSNRLIGKPMPAGQIEQVIPAEHFITGVQPRLRPD